MKKYTLIFIMGLMLLGGCETVKGLGADIQKAGKALEDKASD
jgi:predicted small secreted protein